MSRHVDVILNLGSGISSETNAESIRALFSQHGIDARVFSPTEKNGLFASIEKATNEDREILVAAGGDGTVSVCAAAAIRHGKTLGVLPLGTLNNFSKDIGIPQTLEEAVEMIATGETKAIDVAEVNGRIFINNSSIGLYPRIVIRREKQQRLGRGKWFAAFWAALKVIRLSHFLNVKLVIDGREIRRKTPFVFVGNNDYEMDLYNIGRRPSLSDGKLSVYFLRRGGRWGVIVMLLKTMIGRVKQWRDFEQFQTSEGLTIISRKKYLPVAFDGEVGVIDTPLEYTILPGALKVIVPKNDA